MKSNDEKVAIIGVGHSKFGKRLDVSINELGWEAIKPALQDAGITQKDVGFYSVGNFGYWSEEILPAVTIGEYAGLTCGSLKTEAACASGSASLKIAMDSILSGNSDIAMAMGIEKMYNSPNGTIIELIGRAGNYFWEFENFGMTFPGYYALYATKYLDAFNSKEEDLCEAAVKAHHYGSMNPYAQFRKETSVEECMKSKYVSRPLKLMDSSPITDGAAAVILARGDVAKKLSDTPVYIESQGTATGTAYMGRRDDYTGLEASRRAAEIAYRGAGLDGVGNNFDLFEVHDCFTIAEVMAYEDLGLAKKGEGIRLLKEHQTYKDGKFPVNLDGGLKSKGHPIGATGISQAVEITKQLREEADNGRQVQVNRGRALQHNVGGTGHYAYVTIYSRGD
ncbi:MAG: thiolase domain-containing protein [Candidatus Thermoplasmatota archaeon]|nr:thiolase domain-containing protein [Candidatus Thermoplasmatota archaeon]MCL6002928.1 thiolase domain-containing protein [Candidatus Thermoplasmatota archaeon]